MALNVRMTPRFNVTEIMNTTLKQDWFEFQEHAHSTGKALLSYMQSYIASNHKRKGGTGKLAGAMEMHTFSTTAKIHWGIGHIPTLNRRVKGWGNHPYWYVVNYGKKTNGQDFIPGGGQYRPVMFEDGPADPSKRGRGTFRVTKVKKIVGDEPVPSVIRPMNYIEATQKMLETHVKNLLARFLRR